METIILYLGIIVSFGVVLGHLMKKLNVPSVAGYVIAGIFVGPSVFNLISADMASLFTPVTDIALAFLAFSAGTELFIPKVKESGVSLIIISFAEVFTTWILVTSILYILGLNIYIAFLLGALSSSTSPAPILMIKKQFATKSKLIDESIAICAVDDSLGIVVFGVAKAVVGAGYNSTDPITVLALVQPVFIELSISLFFGVVIGIGLGFLINTFAKSRDDEVLSFYLETTFLSVLLSLSFAYLFDGSTILLPLVAGFAFTNVVNKEVFDLETKVVDLFALPFLIIFFTLAGIQIDIDALKAVWFLSIMYVIFRGVGKYVGGFLGGVLTKHTSRYNNQVGLMLLPLGGVEIGLALSAQEVLSESEGNQVKLIVLSGTLVFSVLGTLIVSKSLRNSGDINIQGNH